MANQTESYMGVRKQRVLSAPGRIFVERYLSPKGKRLLWDANTKKEKKDVWAKYGKNRYRINPDAKPVKIITHYI
jgi:hypothetical protein